MKNTILVCMTVSRVVEWITFIGQKLTKWNDELIMQFYSTAHFYPDGRIVWMSEGTRYQSTIEEWANLINACYVSS